MLLTTKPPTTAELLVGALQSEGLTARVERNELGSIYGHNTFAARVLVPADQLAEAQRQLQLLEAAGQ